MSWLSDLFSSDPPPTSASAPVGSEEWWSQQRTAKPSNTLGGSSSFDWYQRNKQFDPQVVAQQKAADDAAAQKALQDQIDAAKKSGGGPTPTPQPSPEEQLNQLRQGALASINAALPTGFEQGAAPSSLVDPYAASAYAGQRGSAEDLIANMLRRGTITESGRTAGLQALDTQTPGIKSKLSDIGSLLVEQERAGLRDIAGRGRAAANSLQLGQTFDPSVYTGQVGKSVSDFTSGLPGAYASKVPSGLFDTSGLGTAAGAVSGPQNISYDPYAVAGGSLGAGSTGLQDQPQLGASPAPTRRTSVF